MAKVLRRICLYDQRIQDGDDVLELKRGKEYITSAEPKNGKVVVFSTYWGSVPVEWFAGPLPL